METSEAYLERKLAELRLLNGCLSTPLTLSAPVSVNDVIRHKFQLTAALKAEHALQHWADTETDWSHTDRHRAGPFEFSYDYQRADLDVRGPDFYEFGDGIACDTIYAASGMAAISALVLASARSIDNAEILVLAGSYGETQELIERHAGHLRLVTLGQAQTSRRSKSSRRILLLDSSAPAVAFDDALRGVAAELDLLIFDTTCFFGGSGRIRRVLRRARSAGVPVVLVRSHNKLDSLGAEYGRLGSVAFVFAEDDGAWGRGTAFGALPYQTRDAVRLFGGAALPAHFPPFVGTPAYRALTMRRTAAILRNSRRASRHFVAALAGLTAELNYVHGLYVTLAGRQELDEASARRAAAAMSKDLGKAGLPIRHAGSFGFDFAATEWFHDATTDRYSVRVAIPDLPTALWDDLAKAIAQWWSVNQRRCAAA